MCMHPQEALGFIAVSSILVITPLPDITNKKSRVTLMEWVRVTIYKEIYTLPVKMVTSRAPNRSWPIEVNKAWP
jgi:hypothetical protein